ncbi:MAG: hypothetical protein GY730_08850 [bacterium]|nr:hypothetical protein [bacterium]
MTMKIGLLGYGKSGKVTAAELQETHDVELKWILKKEVLKHRVGNIKAKIYGLSEVGDVASFLDKNEVDAVIDFSHKSSINLYPAIIASGTKIVSTISNYGQEEKDILNECARQGSILYAPNITIGINVILQISRQVQKIVPDAAIKIKEVHFEGKKEMSATAKK